METDFCSVVCFNLLMGNAWCDKVWLCMMSVEYLHRHIMNSYYMPMSISCDGNECLCEIIKGCPLIFINIEVCYCWTSELVRYTLTVQ